MDNKPDTQSTAAGQSKVSTEQRVDDLMQLSDVVEQLYGCTAVDNGQRSI